MDKQAKHNDWDRIAAIVAATWLILVGAQAVVHLMRYQMQPPPEWAWRLDFTPVYLPLLAGTALFVILRRFVRPAGNPPERDQH